MLWASARSPNLPTARLANRAPPLSEAVAPVNTMVPPGTPARVGAVIRLAAACPTRNPPKQPTRQQRSKSAGSISMIPAGTNAPAL